MKTIFQCFLVTWGLLVLSTCGFRTNSDTDKVSAKGSLSIVESKGTTTGKGEKIGLNIALVNSKNVTGSKVSFSSSDPSVAILNPSTCIVSSENSCRVMVHGLSAGTSTITASADGYESSSVVHTVDPTVQYGKVMINDNTSDFTIIGQAGKTVRLIGQLDQAANLSGIPINISSTSADVKSTPAQMNVDSNFDLNHFAQFIVSLPSTPGTYSLKAAVVGDLASHYTPLIITLKVQAQAFAGTLVLDPGNVNVPMGMSSPAWLTLNDSSGMENISVTFSSSNTNIVTVSPSSCTLSSDIPVCALGIKSVALGTATITATASNYEINTISATVSAASTKGRTFKFTNKAASDLWVGITSGTSNSYISSSGIPSASNATTCGLSNQMGACPTGSICGQGGANPDAKTEWFCYWQQPEPSDGDYKINSASHPSTSIFISDSSYDHIKDITWSGNFYGRQLCDSTGSCQIGSCGNKSTGFACALGAGGSPSILTLAEVTLQHVNNDYYDVSIINGSNVPISFEPTTDAQTASLYFCSVPGSYSAQGTLKASSWDFATTVQETGKTPYYHYISGRASTPTCTSDSNCASGEVCGYNISAVNNGTNSNYALTCGKHLSWLTADELWALNSDHASNKAPFSFSSSYTTTVDSKTITYDMLFGCPAPMVSGYDSSVPSTKADFACGCTNWDGIASPDGVCVNNNSKWETNVLGTLTWLKKACPTCYTYPYDDKSSTFQCRSSSTSGANTVVYEVVFH